MVRAGAVAAILLSLAAACAVREGDSEYVVVEHNVNQPGPAQWVADRHCAAYGKTAVLVQRSPHEPSPRFLLTETSFSRYACVPKTG